MTIPFSKTTRFLQSDRYLLRSIWLILILALLAIWLTWFTQARISMWAESNAASLRTSSDIEAIFPSEAFFQLEIGQTGRFVLNDSPTQNPIVLPATITRIDPQDNQLLVRLALEDNSGNNVGLQPGLTGRIEVEVDQLTPFEILLQTYRLNFS